VKSNVFFLIPQRQPSGQVDSKQPITISDLIRRGASKLRAKYRRTRIWKVDDLKLAYISIPKVASSSTRRLMNKRQGQAKPGPDPAKISLSISQLQCLRDEYFLFSFVRNPLTRLYSCYRDKVVNAETRHKRCTFSPYQIHFGMTFDDFVCRVVQIPDKSADQHLRSLSSFLVHSGELLVDYVGKFENIAEDWEVISTRFGLLLPARTKRVSGPQMSMKDIPLSTASLELVITHYAQDLDAFGYRAELEALLRKFPGGSPASIKEQY
jgi:dermatan 4-sulfotransferase 1